MGDTDQSILVNGFSRKTGIQSLRHNLMQDAVRCMVILPTWILAQFLSESPGSPNKWSLSRIAHQLLPGGPRRARDQEVQGVPHQTAKMAPLLIQPEMIRQTTGLVTPSLMSTHRTLKPRARSALDKRPDPEKSSKKKQRFLGPLLRLAA